jgi:molybdenum cofactor cytidylyltransferase
VVVGATPEPVARALEGLPLRLVLNRAWAEGTGGSIACGARAALAADAGGILLTMADQPLVTAVDLSAMIARLWETGAPAVAACYDGVLGVPAVFAGAAAAALTELHGSEGARRVLAKLGPAVVRFDLPDAAFDVDIDGEADHLVARS